MKRPTPIVRYGPLVRPPGGRRLCRYWASASGHLGHAPRRPLSPPMWSPRSSVTTRVATRSGLSTRGVPSGAVGTTTSRLPSSCASSGWEAREQELRNRSLALTERHWSEIAAVAEELLRIEVLHETEVEILADVAAGQVNPELPIEITDLAAYRRVRGESLEQWRQRQIVGDDLGGA